METASQNLRDTLQAARKSQRISQLELALRMGISQRHVSFVESGRAQPSRELLLSWLHELQAPLALRNAALQQAGFAPVYRGSELSEAVLAPVREALDRLLAAHDPMPAMVMDAMLHPDGMTRHMTNLEEVAPAMLAHLRDDASVVPDLLPRVALLTAQIQKRVGKKAMTPWPRQMAPVLTTRFATKHGELAFFSMFSTFGTPQDITLASLRVEHVFAADEHTRAVILSQ